MKQILLILAIFIVVKKLPIATAHNSYYQKRSIPGFQGGLSFNAYPFPPQVPGLFPPPLLPPFPPSSFPLPFPSPFPPPFPPAFPPPFGFPCPYPPPFGFPGPYPPPYGYPAVPAPNPPPPPPTNPNATGISGLIQSIIGAKTAPPPPPPPAALPFPAFPFQAYPYPVASPVPVPIPYKVPVPIHVLKTLHMPAVQYPVEQQHQSQVSPGHITQTQFESDHIEPWNSL